MKNFRLKIILLLAIIFFFLINLFGFSPAAKNFFYSVSKPLQIAFWRGGEKTASFFEAAKSFLKPVQLEREKRACDQENKELLSKFVETEDLRKENRALREALDLELKKEFQLSFVKIIGKDAAGDNIFINQGEADGLKPDLPVITAQKVIVGRITNLQSHLAEVALIANPESSLTGKLFQKEIFGLIKGKGNWRISFEDLPKKAAVEKGDLVVTTALAGLTPGGLLVGKISQVENPDISPFQTAELEPLFNLNENTYLFVITQF